VNRVLRADCVQDALFLSLVVLLSIAPYVRELGFYSDQWLWLAALAAAPDRSFGGLFQSINYPHSVMRPVEVLQFTSLYWLFGRQPLGYHLVNSLTLVLVVVLFYLALRQLGMPRVLALAVPAIYGLLPHYSTVRFWSFATPLSIALYFLSLNADLRLLQTAGTRRVVWRLIGLFGLLGSTLAKELALPLFFLNPLLVLARQHSLRRRFERKRPFPINPAFLILPSVLALAVVIAFKALTTTRLITEPLLERTLRIARHAIALDIPYFEGGLNIQRAVVVAYGELGVDLPAAVQTALQVNTGPWTLGLAVTLGISIYWYLVRRATRPDDGLPSGSGMLSLIVAGIVLFVLGYAIFLTNESVGFTAAGQNNRSAMAAAIGVSFTVTGAVGLLSGLPPVDQWKRRAFALLVTAYCVAGFTVVTAIGRFWVESSAQQQVILADIQQRFPTLPAGTTFLLDGVCPYAGPAPVFEHQWDLRAALQLTYGDYTLRGDVVTPRLRIEERWLASSTYGEEEQHPYGEILVYDYRRKQASWLTSREAADQYFRSHNPDHTSGCPEGHPGFGVSVFGH
jgi:hypothetical protein